MIEGTYFHQAKNSSAECLLVASVDSTPIGHWWCKNETTADYMRLLDKSAASAQVVVTDGCRSALVAIKRVWPQARIQRCLVHIERKVIALVSRNPQTEVGKLLLGLARGLRQIYCQREWSKTLRRKVAIPLEVRRQRAAQWEETFDIFEAVFEKTLNEWTYVKDVDADKIPKNKRNNKK